MEATKTSFNGRRGNQTMEHPYNRILFDPTGWMKSGGIWLAQVGGACNS